MQRTNSLHLCWWEGSNMVEKPSSWPDTKDSDFKDALELATEERKPTVTTNLSLNDSDSNFFEWTKRVSKFLPSFELWPM
ncbi:hypothetical protein TNCT_541741 [Trichonephila clavata]|uniref:Uncharacterized protein n=1 Tax=Trichonephila clavata TaxID=2740835 RepID=A0A8X6KRV7_TRICU|nr:hypothetical protein TNCT_541741 [Trichonephila clavata]